jgi:hypothetical protein
LDVERAAVLYPKQHVNPPKNPQGKRSGDANALEAAFPGELTATIRPVPTNFPRSANDSSASQMPADTQVAKRWFSLPTPQEGHPGPIDLWPACGHEGAPVIVSYCFEGVNLFERISTAFMEALARWAPAMYRSALGFAPDASCSGDLEVPCLCSEGVDEATVHIMQSPDRMFRVTFGYLDPVKPRPNPNKPRHYMEVPTDPDLSNEVLGMQIAHRLGENFRSMSFSRDP